MLSCGHSSLTLYIQLYLSGYGLTLDDLEHYRTWGSRTPGHPEHGLTPGVETTTGPLGQGLGNAVGMAMAARRERGLLDPDAAPGTSPFDHHIYAFASDGDIEEGISHEVSSLAGHQQLGNLIVLYDDNTISIEDDTNIAKSEDVCARYEAYGWHVQRVGWRTAGGYHEDVEALADAFDHGQGEHRAAVVHRAADDHRLARAGRAEHRRGARGRAGRRGGGQDQASPRLRPGGVLPRRGRGRRHARKVADRGKRLHAEWDESFAAWRDANPGRAALLDRLAARRLPDGWASALPSSRRTPRAPPPDGPLARC